MKQETTIVKYIQDIYVALLYIWFIQKAEMVYIFARLAEQNNHLNEFGKANIKLHNYRCPFFIRIVLYHKVFETAPLMTRIDLCAQSMMQRCDLAHHNLVMHFRDGYSCFKGKFH